MVRATRPLPDVLLAITCLCVTAQSRAIGYQPTLPFTYIFDTGTPAAETLSETALAERSGWTQLAEEQLAYTFRGDAVLANDKLTVVVRAKGAGAEIYTQTKEGIRRRAALAALPQAASTVSSVTSLRVLENNPGAVMLACTVGASDGQAPCAAAFRLAAGQGIVEVHPQQGADRFFVECRPAWVVVPDFFADDMVFGRTSAASARMGLPAENFLLNLLPGGDAMIMCVWASASRSCLISEGRAGDREIRGCEVEAREGKPLSVAFFEGSGLWHEWAPSAGNVGGNLPPGWTPPFEAKWRTDLVSAGGYARSFLWEGDGLPSQDELGPKEPQALAAVVYPLDRDRKTPLTAFCPTDVIRQTLGVGPCQYILQTECLATDTNPTPDQVMTWVERQFERNRQQEEAEAIRQMLDEMTTHVEHAEERITHYGGFALRAREILRAAASGDGDSTAFAGLDESVRRLEQALQHTGGSENRPARAGELADAVAALIGKAGAADECRRLGDQLRQIGAEQDATLSRCRMIVRWLREQAAVDVSPSEAVASQLREHCDGFLSGQ